MCFAFEITEDDVANVYHNKFQKAVSNQKLDRIFELLNFQKINKVALYGDSIEEQTEYAYQEIADQIKKIN